MDIKNFEKLVINDFNKGIGKMCYAIKPLDFLFSTIQKIFNVQGISYWSVKSNSALRGRSINHFIDLWFIVGSGGLEIWVSSTSFQKSNIYWPQQPLTEKVLVVNLTFHDSTPKHYFFKTSKTKLNSITWMTLKPPVVIFKALEPL